MPFKEQKVILQRHHIKLDNVGIFGKFNLTFESPIHLANIEIRSSVTVKAYSYFRGGRLSASIGRYCCLAPDVFIGDGNHPTNYLSCHPFQYQHGFYNDTVHGEKFFTNLKMTTEINRNTPCIGNDVWIGTNVVIMRGVIIGDGAIIAAGSIVTKNVPPYAIVGGTPAKIIKYRFTEDVINKLIALEWWNYHIDTLSNLPFNDIYSCIDKIEEIKTNKKSDIFKTIRIADNKLTIFENIKD